jgi:hypothetical protein
MQGRWGIFFAIAPPQGAPFSVLLLDRSGS